ncbi:hypothetical protein [Mesorhizobium sp. ES1-4]|uniref:hypothetical protein n=1 Tax=Mesorhizobium sp. ES1-4 TaxID=2876627 RepID=UPI001CCC8BB6|nr:hypothetical protein [Mesorhizobium sp. ES1-4]MBZ9794319.1 hypothetical protein [Mesorhizobium sp. ES1-4]
MSYDTPESSVDDGEPYFLYLFNNGVTKHRFTSDADAFMADPEETGTPQKWYPSSISHTEIEQTGNIEKNAVDITFPLSDPYARTLQKPGSEVVTATIWRGHHTDPDGELEVFWKGRVVDTADQKLNIKVTVEHASTSMRRTGCAAQYMRPCRHALYFPGCNLNVDDWKIPATVSAVTGGLLLTIAEAAAETDQWYKAGVVIYDGLYGWVGDQIGDQVTLIASGIEGLAERIAADGSAAVFIAPGCDLSSGPTGCDKFDNTIEYGGFEFMADVNPFSQSIT